jgi:HEAT repeat protein
VIEALRTLLGDPDPKVREEIGGGLSWRDPHAIDVLIGLLKDPATPADRSGEVRRCLVRLVTKDLGDPAAWEAWWAQNRTKWLNWDPTAPRPRP